MAKTYIELLKERPLLEGVIANLYLQSDVDELEGRIEVRPARDTQLIQVMGEDADASLATTMPNWLPRAFVGQNQALQSERFAASKERLSQQMEELNS